MITRKTYMNVMCSNTKKPLPFKAPVDFDPLGDEDADLEVKSDIWFLRYAVQRDESDTMERFLKFVFTNDKLVCERCLVWAAKNDSINRIITLFEIYRPHINLQAAPLFYAVRNENEHLCGMILDEMEKRVAEKYTVMSMCFKEIIKKDMVDVGDRVLRSRFYKPTDTDFALARKIGGEFEEKLMIRDPKNLVVNEDEDIDIGDWDSHVDDQGDVDLEDDVTEGGERRYQDPNEGKHDAYDEQKHDTFSEMSDFEPIPNPMDLVQSVTEDEIEPSNLKNPQFSESEFSEIDVGMESDQSFVML
eukprot:TRINITY_DN50_c0_g1_i4.p1 TRINITY_DN50_c0_g1~~TRINITY_DN50_c0_g1_i4.p1  ORF type:complete len:303 (-),score=57.66 TRINITY_DN50_c0_g1_i4:162-1070(-)